MGPGGIHTHSFGEHYNKVFNSGRVTNNAFLKDWTTQYFIVARGFPCTKTTVPENPLTTTCPVSVDYAWHYTISARAVLGGSPYGQDSGFIA